MGWVEELFLVRVDLEDGLRFLKTTSLRCNTLHVWPCMCYS